MDDYFQSIAFQAKGQTVPEAIWKQEATRQLVAAEIDRLEAEERGIILTDVSGNLLHQKLIDSLGADVTVSEDEARALYDANISNYVYPEERQIR